MNICGICLDNINDPVSGNCTHRFCRLCYSNWLEFNRNCPSCRLSVNELSSFSFSSDSLINLIGLNSIHSHTSNNQIIIYFEKGKDIDILQSEKDFIKNLTGYNIGNKIQENSSNKLVCLINGNIITLGMKINNSSNTFFIKDGIAVIRQTKKTFPVSPSNRIYNKSNQNIIYELKK